MLLHDNARLHITNQTKVNLQQFNYEILDHTVYSPDLSPPEYHLFRYLELFNWGMKYVNIREIMTVYMSNL